MGFAGRNRTRFLVAFLAVAVILGVLIVWLGRLPRNGSRQVLTLSSAPENNANALAPSVSPTATAPPASPIASPSAPSASPVLPVSPEQTPSNNLIIPVAGV